MKLIAFARAMASTCAAALLPAPAHAADWTTPRATARPTAAANGSPASATTGPTAATPEGEGPRYSVGGLVGVTSDFYGIGIGARAGATISERIYLGVFGMYYAGSTFATGNAAWSVHAIQLGGEAGYGFAIRPIVLRPFVGLGILSGFGSTTTGVGPTPAATATTGNGTGLALSTGVTGAYRFSATPFAVGGEFRILAPLDGRAVGAGAFAMASMMF